MASLLLLPGMPGFYETLYSRIPPHDGSRETVFIVRAGGSVLEPVSDEVANEYLNGGEFEEREAEMEVLEDEEEWIPGDSLTYFSL